VTTSNKGLNQPTYNTYVNTWGTGPLNDNFGNIDLALGGSTLLNATGLGGTTVVLTASQCIPLTISVSGTPGGIVTYSVPAGAGGQWVVRNGTTGGYAIRIQSAAGGSYVSVSAGTNALVSCDGSSTGMVSSISAPPAAAGSTTQVQYNSSGVLAGSASMTFDGTTLVVTGLNNSGNTVLGDVAGDTITINSNNVAIPNTLNIGSNNLYLSGTQVGIGTTTVGTDKLTVAGTIKSTSGGFVYPDGSTQTTAVSLPPGTVVAYALPVAPAGYLLCAGQAVNKADYTALDAVFSASSYPYGSTSTTFTLPDLRGRVVVGVDNMSGDTSPPGRVTSATVSPNGNTVGAFGGTEQVTLTTAQMPIHSHGVTDPTHAHNISAAAGYTGTNSGLGGVGSGPLMNTTYPAAGGTDAAATGISIQNAGSGNAHLNMQPSVLMYYVIKT
jgi:hypothetical protein